MNINIKAADLQSGGLFGRNNGLKSTQQRLARKQECDDKVAFFEKQKENLKGMKCGTVEEIADKLEMLHSYEDQIAAAKAAYNNEQMMHLMDESNERAKKIAEAAEKTAPKTPEERKKEMVEEAMGIEKGGMLDEMLDEAIEDVEEMTEEVTEEITEKVSEDLTKDVAEEVPEDLANVVTEEVPENLTKDTAGELADTLDKELADAAVQARRARRLRKFDTYI